MTRLPPKQQAVMDYISSCGVIPSCQAIARHMGWKNPSTAVDCLMALAARGKVRVADRQPFGRGWRYTWEIVQ